MAWPAGLVLLPVLLAGDSHRNPGRNHCQLAVYFEISALVSGDDAGGDHTVNYHPAHGLVNALASGTPPGGFDERIAKFVELFGRLLCDPAGDRDWSNDVFRPGRAGQ